MDILPQSPADSVPHLCACGCGLPVPLARRSDARKGWVRGHPLRYLPRHYHPPKQPKILRTEPKRCTLCGQFKPPNDFNRCSAHTDGLASWCRACNKSNIKDWAADNPARKATVNARWYAGNAAQVKENVRRWRQANHSRYLWHHRTRRAKQRSASGHASAEQIAARVAFFGHRCSYCGGPYEHLDHAIPLSRGGSAWPANLRPACMKCNTQKGAKTYFEWRGCSAGVARR